MPALSLSEAQRRPTTVLTENECYADYLLGVNPADLSMVP